MSDVWSWDEGRGRGAALQASRDWRTGRPSPARDTGSRSCSAGLHVAEAEDRAPLFRVVCGRRDQAEARIGGDRRSGLERLPFDIESKLHLTLGRIRFEDCVHILQRFAGDIGPLDRKSPGASDRGRGVAIVRLQATG